MKATKNFNRSDINSFIDFLSSASCDSLELFRGVDPASALERRSYYRIYRIFSTYLDLVINSSYSYRFILRFIVSDYRYFSKRKDPHAPVYMYIYECLVNRDFYSVDFVVLSAFNICSKNR